MKIFKLLFLFLLSTYFISCVDVPDEIILPEWDVDLNVPIINRVYTLDEILESQAHITIDTTEDIYLLQSDKYYLNSGVSEFVQINESASLENVPTITTDQTFEVYVPFPEQIEITKAELSQGNINFSVTNPTLTEASIILTLPGFQDLQGNIITLQANVSPGETASINKNLSGYTYEIPSGQPLELSNSFKILIRAFSQQPGSIVYTDLSISDMSFNYVTGKVPAKSLGDKVSRYDFEVNEIGEYRDKAFLRDAKLNLKASYISMFNTPTDLEIRNLNIIGKRNDGTELYLRDNFNNPYFTIKMLNGNYSNTFTEANSNINDFITFLPDSVILRAEYIVNPDNKNGTFSNVDSIRFETDFSTKSYLALKNTTIEEESSIELTDSDREDIKDGKGAEINFEIENGIPLAAWLKVDLLDANKNYLFTLTTNDLEGDSLSFGAASVNANGEAVQPYLNPVKKISLNESQVQLFQKAYYISYRVSFSTKDSDLTPVNYVSIRPSNWIKLKAYGLVKYKISLDD